MHRMTLKTLSLGGARSVRLYPMAVVAAALGIAGCGVGDSGAAEGELGRATQALEGCVVTPPPDVTAATCPAAIVVAVGEATASGCSEPVVGEVIATNGEPLDVPVPVVGGEVELGPGVHTISWFVESEPVVSATQTVTVNPGLQSGQSFLVGDRGSVGIITGSQSGPAGLFNSGVGPVVIGHDAFAGDVISVGPVSVLDRADLIGGIVSEGAVSVAPSASVAGPVVAFGDVSLPGLPALPVFPPVTGGNRSVNSGVTSSLAPGSYGTVTVGSGGRLVLAAGDYFFQNLIVNSGAVATVANPAAGSSSSATRVFASNQLVLPGPFQGPGGLSLIPTVVGFSGGGNLSFNRDFIGTVVAPNAELVLGSGSGSQFIGAFYARVLRVSNGSQLLCNFLSAVGGQL